MDHDTMSDVTAFVTGATGYTGRSVVALLRRRGVTTLAHMRPESTRATAHVRDFEALGARIISCPWNAAELDAVMDAERPQVVFCLIGTTRARARKDNVKGDIYDTIDYGLSSMLLHAAAMCQSQPKFIYLSCMGIGTSEPRNSYLRARYKIERELRESGLSWVSARPSFITGDRRELRPMESLGARLLNSAVSVATAVGAKKWAATYRSQTGQELAHALVTAALSDEYRDCIIESDELQQLHRLDD